MSVVKVSATGETVSETDLLAEETPDETSEETVEIPDVTDLVVLESPVCIVFSPDVTVSPIFENIEGFFSKDCLEYEVDAVIEGVFIGLTDAVLAVCILESELLIVSVIINQKYTIYIILYILLSVINLLLIFYCFE